MHMAGMACVNFAGPGQSGKREHDMRWYRTAIVLLAAILWPVGTPAAAQDPAFTEIFEVTRTEWYRGQDVELRFTQCNTSESPATYCRSICRLPGEPVRIFELSGVEIAQFDGDAGTACSPACTPEVWQPGQCETTVYKWPQIEANFPVVLPTFIPVPPPPLADSGVYYAESGDGSGALRTENFRLLGLPPPVPMLRGAGIALLITLMTVTGWRVARIRGS